MLGNLLTGKKIVRAGYRNKKGKRVVRAGYGNNMDFNAVSFFNKLWNTEVGKKSERT